MTYEEKRAFLRDVNRIKVAAYLIKYAKCCKGKCKKCAQCGCSQFDKMGNCCKCGACGKEGACGKSGSCCKGGGCSAKQAILSYYNR